MQIRARLRWGAIVAALAACLPAVAHGDGAASPVTGRAAVIAPAGGDVRYGGADGRRAALARATKIPIGSEIDASRGRVQVTSTSSSGGTQVGLFSGAALRIAQPHSARVFLTTTLRLEGGDFRTCHAAGTSPSVMIRRVSASTHMASFATAGAEATATAYGGAAWVVSDTCGGTVVTVTRGNVIVHDAVSGNTVTVPAGQSLDTGSASVPGTPEGAKHAAAPPDGPRHGPGTVFLDSVACPSSGTCAAVGYDTDWLGNDHPLTEDETGGVWGDPTELPLPANAMSVQGTGTALTSVSCPAVGACAAVGHYVDATGNYEPLAVSQSGGAWGAAVEPALPSDASSAGSTQSSGLTSVSCAAPGNCVAVGSYLGAGADRVELALSSSGGSWGAPVALTLPANALDPVNQYSPGRVASVSCPAAGACVAVGSYEDTAGNIEPMAGTETGGTWSGFSELTLPSTARNGAQMAGLTSASCAAAGSCSAVGSFLDARGHQQAMTAAASGGQWSGGAELPLPGSAVAANPGGALSSVSCVAAGSCVATGTYAARGANDAVLESVETGGVWSAGATILLPGDAARPETDAALPAVACAAAGDCAAVGWYALLHGGTSPFTATLAP